MARGTSAADQTMVASSCNNQGESFNSMGLEHYSAAAKGDFKKFEHSDSEALAKILTPNDNTILHIHITARPRSKISQNIEFLRGVDILQKVVNKIIARPRSKISQNIDFLRGILGKCSDLLWKVNKKGETLLHMAARYGHADVTKFLLEECKKKPHKNHDDYQELGITPTRRMLQMTSHGAKDTALHEAVRYGQLDVVKVLTEADPELSYEANTDGETPLYLAAERGYAEVLKEILKTWTSPADHGPYDRTALHVAVIRKDEEMVEGLLEAGEGIHKSKHDQNGWTPLHFAVHLGYIEIMNKLLSKDNLTAYKADKKGKTALHVAAGHGRVDIMRELISKCPDCCELVDDRGRNVLHFALESRNKKAVNLVLENPLLGNLINEKDENGNTPYLHAASIGYNPMKHPKVDMQVFNLHDHNANDIILGNNPTSRGFEIMLDRSVRLKENCKLEDEDKMSSQSNDGKRENRSRSNIMDKARENELVTATLIATVTFAAGITVPGGFVADKGPDQGAAILTRNTAFRAFVLLNTTSMYFSWQAVMINLYESSFVPVMDRRMPLGLSRMPLHQWRMPLNLWRLPLDLLRFRQTLLAFAMWAMLLAFLSGTWAVLHSDKILAYSACFVPCVLCAFLQLVYLLLKNGSVIYNLLKNGSTVTEVVRFIVRSIMGY